MKKIAIVILGGLVMVLVGVGIACFANRQPDRRAELARIVDGIPTVDKAGPPSRWPNPDGDAEIEGEDSEFRLKMILLFSKLNENTNNVTANDLDLTGWEEVEKKRKPGESSPLKAFLESAWEKANAKKLSQSPR